MNIWTLPTQAHRDLWWLLTCPNIIENSGASGIDTPEKSSWLEDAWNWIQRDAQCPANLTQWVQHPHRQKKLGLYAEDLLHYYLQWGSPWHVRWHDVQIQEERRSIGAIDFILEHNNLVEHWEMTVKFYLQHKPTGEWTDWVGADQRDSLYKKWHHFHTKQLPLGRHPATISQLIQANLPTPQQSRIWHCGMLFTEWNQPCVLPKPSAYGTVNTKQPLGYWIRRRDFIQQFFSPKHRWVIRQHPQWLSPIETADAQSTVEIMDTPSPRGFWMLAKMIAHNDGWREEQRWVLVDDNWGQNLNA